MNADAKKDVDAAYLAAPAVGRVRQLTELNDSALRKVAADRAEDADVRREALRSLYNRDVPGEQRIEVALDVLEDNAASRELRADALQQAGLLPFNPSLYAQYRPRYIDVLRKAAQAADPELRLLALEKLAAEKDPWAMDEIRNGIDSPQTALIPVSEAVSLLSYDPKAEIFPVLERIVDGSDDPDVRALALRVLAADGASKDRMERIATDRNELDVVRRAAAAGLRSLDQARLRDVAKQIALDESESSEMRAASFAALSTLEGDDDGEVVAGAEKVSARESASNALTRGAQSYLQRRR